MNTANIDKRNFFRTVDCALACSESLQAMLFKLFHDSTANK